MFLKSLALENVRCFKRLEIDFSIGAAEEAAIGQGIRKWTILLGQNGLGKSTILRAAALLAAGSRALEQLIEAPEIWIRNSESNCLLSATLQNRHGDEHPIEITMARGQSVSHIVSSASRELSAIDESLSSADEFSFLAGYGATRRLDDGGSLKWERPRYRDPRARSIATLFDPAALLNPLEAWAIDLDYQRGDEGLKTVRRVLSSFLPGMTFSHIDRQEKQLVFATVDGPVPLSELSDGFQTVAAWVGDLLFRIHDVAGEFSNPLEAHGLLIIDEVDVHLHPLWQRQLHEFLTNKLPNMQLLVTTHSAVTAQQAGISELHFLGRERRGIQLQRFDADPSSLLVSQLLISEAFGLETLESRELAAKKVAYRSLRDRVQRSAKQEQRLESLARELGEVRYGRTADAVPPDPELARLAQLQERLRRRTLK